MLMVSDRFHFGLLAHSVLFFWPVAKAAFVSNLLHLAHVEVTNLIWGKANCHTRQID